MKVLILNPPSKSTKNVLRDLIYGCWCKGKRIGGAKVPPLNLLYIATVLRDNGHEVELLDALAEQRDLDYVSKIAKRYDSIVISTSTMSFDEDSQVLAELKKANKDLDTIIFGSHPTFMPEYALKKGSIDIIVRREPEYVIRDVVNALEKGDDSWKKIRGIGYRENGKQILNEFYPFIENLDEVPFPDRALLPERLDYFNPIIKRIPYTTMMTSRGCPGKCTFCTVPYFYGSSVRKRSAENVLDELRLIEKQGYREVWIRDETFTFFRERNERVCKTIIDEKMDLTWICNARVGTVDNEIMELMKKAGCHMIKFGVESGVQEVLNNVKKGVKVEMTRKNFKEAHEVGMDTHAHIMLGMPGDTRETVEKTIRFVREIDPTTATFGICTPYAGTELFQSVIEKHPEILDGSSQDLEKVHETAFFNQYFTDLKPEELEGYVKKAYRNFYFKPGYVLKWLRKIRSMDELKRAVLAGTNIFEFSVGMD
jgi:anaerobic magnesium-protoporphyrin IX monomethyl ester cyclase